MNGLLLAMAWGVVAAIGFTALSKFERSSRLIVRAERPSLAPARALWGGDPVHPPSRALTARMLAGFARLARPRSVVADHQQVLRAVARGLGATALFIGLAMLPFVGAWGGGEGAALVLFDAKQGLALIALLRQGIARLIGIDQDLGRNTLLKQLLEVAATQALQHLGLLCRRRPEMALNKPSAQEPPSTLAL